MKPECSLPHEQRRSPVPALSPIKPVHASSLHLFKIHFNIIVPYTPTSSKWHLSLRSPTQSLVCTSSASHTCHMLHSSHSAWFDHRKPNKIFPNWKHNFSCKKKSTLLSVMGIIWFRQSACTSTMMHRFRVHCLSPPPPNKQQAT